jgi:hypothetical protein
MHKQAEVVSDTCLFMLMLEERGAVNNIARHPAGEVPTSRLIHASIILHKCSSGYVPVASKYAYSISISYSVVPTAVC